MFWCVRVDSQPGDGHFSGGNGVAGHLVARRFMVGAISALPALLFASFIMHGGFDATHHWFSTIAVMAAMLVFFDGTNSARAAAVGALCGLAAFFTQTKGATAVVAFVAYLVWKTWQDGNGAGECARKCVLLCGAAAGVFFAANAYFIGASGLQPWLFSTIVFPLKYYSAPSMNNWQVFLDEFRREGGAGRWIAFPFMYATVPLVYIVFLVTMRRRWKKEPSVAWNQLLLVALTGLGMFLAIADSPSMKRLCTVSAPGMILLAWLLSRPGKAQACGRVILAMAAVMLAVGQPVHSQLRWKAYLNLPAGRMAFVDPALYDEYSWVLANTNPGQFFFGLPPLYTPFRMRNPSAIEGIEGTEYTRPEQVAELIRALETHPVPLLILNKSGRLLNPTPRSAGDHLDPFRAYLLKNYRLARTFSTQDDAWQALSTPAMPTPIR